jgi:hypothetical protein
MSNALELAVGIQGLLAVWIGVRSYRNYQGRQYSPGRVAIFPALILLVFLATELETITTVSWAFPIWTSVDVVVLAAGAVATLPLADRLVKVTQRSDGSWYYQYGAELIVFYLALWLVRLGLAAYYDPASLEFVVSPTAMPLSATAADVLVLIQGLFSLSSGLVIGRAICTYRLHQRATTHPLPSAAQPR